MLGSRTVVRNLHIFQQNSLLKPPFISCSLVQKKIESSSSAPSSIIDQYIQRGKERSNNPTKSLLILEDLVKNYSKSEVYSKLLSTKEYQNCGLRDQFFIALGLPSITGKTQMAFNIRSKRPLYFALDDNQDVNAYFNFISSKLMHLLRFDYDKAQKVLQSNPEFKEKLEETRSTLSLNEVTRIITVNFMNNYLGKHKFESLGFLASLVKKCEKLYTESNNDGWMKFYADNQESFLSLEYEPMSFYELMDQKDVYNLILDKYFIFIDEFRADPDVVKFRNFCRLLKIPCVLASTNTGIVNHAGASLDTGSGSSPPSVFCAALPKFSSLSDEEIDRFFNEEINCDRLLELSRNISVNEERRMSLLLQFFKDQAKKSRPGVAVYLFDALKKVAKTLPELKDIKVDNVFKEVIGSMTKSIKLRKIKAFTDPGGMFANITMLGGNNFDPKYRHTSNNDDPAMVDDHFFYMKNPIIKSKGDEEPYLLFRSKGRKNQVFTHPGLYDVLSIQCYFDENEELLKLVCLFADMADSSAVIVYSPFGRRISVLDRGKEQEVVTYAAFLDSSHFTEKDSASLEGVGIKNFLKNLLKNFDEKSEGFRSWDVHLNYENVKDDQILASTVVPCLYIVNHDWPAEIKAIFDAKESSYKLGRYKRTPDCEIDATIDIIDKDGSNRLGVIECKNRQQPVDKGDYTMIINKAFKYAKIKKIENFLDTLRPLIQAEKMESFENFIKSDLRDPNFASVKSTEAFIQNFEDSTKFQTVRSTLKDYIKEESRNEFDTLLKSLDRLKTASPLVHFLICKSQSFSNLKSLKSLFPDRKINFFRFIKKGEEYEIIKAISEVHEEPEMVAFIIETDVINNNKN